MEKQRISRRYLGVTITKENYREILEKEGRDGINFHTKHLKAYLKGKPMFRHKFMKDKILVENEKGEQVEEERVVTDNWGNPRYNEYRVQQQILVPTSDIGDDREDNDGTLHEEGGA